MSLSFAKNRRRGGFNSFDHQIHRPGSDPLLGKPVDASEIRLTTTWDEKNLSK